MSDQKKQLGRYLHLIPAEHRLPAFIFLVVEAVFIVLAISGDTSIKIIAIVIVGILAFTFLPLFFKNSMIIESYRSSQRELEERLRVAQKKLEKGIVEAEQYEKRESETAKSFESQILDRYGIKSSRVSAKVEILDFDGSCRITKVLGGLRVDRGITINSIPRKESFSTPGCHIHRGPRFMGKPNFEKAVLINQKGLYNGSCEFDIDIAGGLTPFDGELGYEYQFEATKAFLMTKEEAEELYGQKRFLEYYYCDIVVPTDYLEIEINFPEVYTVDAFSGVFFGPTEDMHNLELNRVKDGFQKENSKFRFRIDNPLMGFRYIIHWAPLPQCRVDQLKRLR